MEKSIFLTIVGTMGSLVASFFGGWTESLTTLLIFMMIDYATGLIVAGVFKPFLIKSAYTLAMIFTPLSFHTLLQVQVVNFQAANLWIPCTYLHFHNFHILQLQG